MGCRIRWDVLCVLLLVFGELLSAFLFVLVLVAQLGPLCLRYECLVLKDVLH